MNEHDSERISGLLESDGMNNVDNVAAADVVVINTCCIRENADDKFYGTLSQLKNWKNKMVAKFWLRVVWRKKIVI